MPVKERPFLGKCYAVEQFIRSKCTQFKTENKKQNVTENGDRKSRRKGNFRHGVLCMSPNSVAIIYPLHTHNIPEETECDVMTVFTVMPQFNTTQLAIQSD